MVRRFTIRAIAIGIVGLLATACCPIYGNDNYTMSFDNSTINDCRFNCWTEYDIKHCEYFEWVIKNDSCNCSLTRCENGSIQN